MSVCCLVSSEVRVDGSRFLRAGAVYPSFPVIMWSWVVEADEDFHTRALIGIGILRETIERLGPDLSGGMIADLTALEGGGRTRIIFFPSKKT